MPGIFFKCWDVLVRIRKILIGLRCGLPNVQRVRAQNLPLGKSHCDRNRFSSRLLLSCPCIRWKLLQRQTAHNVRSFWVLPATEGRCTLSSNSQQTGLKRLWKLSGYETCSDQRQTRSSRRRTSRCTDLACYICVHRSTSYRPTNTY